MATLTVPRILGQDKAVARPRRRFLEALVTVEAWLDRRAQRQHLRELDDHLLRDIGVSRSAADEEARKPFWRS